MTKDKDPSVSTRYSTARGALNATELNMIHDRIAELSHDCDFLFYFSVMNAVAIGFSFVIAWLRR
jgi:hypothetical protein